jgi:hypothetical protein
VGGDLGTSLKDLCRTVVSEAWGGLGEESYIQDARYMGEGEVGPVESGAYEELTAPGPEDW